MILIASKLLCWVYTEDKVISYHHHLVAVFFFYCFKEIRGGELLSLRCASKHFAVLFMETSMPANIDDLTIRKTLLSKINNADLVK